MLLKEFFGQKIPVSKKDHKDSITDDLFWFILDHDRMHKDYGITLINQLKKNKNLSEDEIITQFSPMVKKGCKEYYIKQKLPGNLGKYFPKEVRQELCQRIYSHYCDNIKG